MTLSLNAEQIEVNCRRIYKYGLDKLEADETGTLNRRVRWYELFFKDHTAHSISDNLPQASALRTREIKPAIMATLDGLCADMKKKLPISFFSMPGIYNFNTSYREIAFIVTALSDDAELYEKAMKVHDAYAAIKFDLHLPKKTSFQHKWIANRWVASRMLHSFHGSIDIATKEDTAAFQVREFRKQFKENRIYDGSRGVYRDKNWLFEEWGAHKSHRS